MLDEPLANSVEWTQHGRTWAFVREERERTPVLPEEVAKSRSI